MQKRRHLQLIQPKLTNREQKAPRTTSQASNPPSGKALGSIKDILVGTFSSSTSLSCSGVSGPSLRVAFECMVSRMGPLGSLAASTSFSLMEALLRVETIDVESSLRFWAFEFDILEDRGLIGAKGQG
jgi:hypothetical protein